MKIIVCYRCVWNVLENREKKKQLLDLLPSTFIQHEMVFKFVETTSFKCTRVETFVVFNRWEMEKSYYMFKWHHIIPETMRLNLNITTKKKHEFIMPLHTIQPSNRRLQLQNIYFQHYVTIFEAQFLIIPSLRLRFYFSFSPLLCVPLLTASSNLFTAFYSIRVKPEMENRKGKYVSSCFWIVSGIWYFVLTSF